MNLPPFLYELSTRIGLPAVKLLVLHCGGTEIYVPKIAKPHSKLYELLGKEAAKVMADHYGGQTITIAQYETSDHIQHHINRRQQIIGMLGIGMAHSKIARELHTSDRTVRKYAKMLRESTNS